MRKAVSVLVGFLLVVPCFAGTDPTAAEASDVRVSVLLAMASWANHPVDTAAATCIGVGDPSPCCTGAGTGPSCIPCGTTGSGTCCSAPATNAECLAFARDFIKPSVGSFTASGWAYKVELTFIDDVAFICNPQVDPVAGGITPCRTLPAQNQVDITVAAALSKQAADQILP